MQKRVDKLIIEGLKISTVKNYLDSVSYIFNQAVKPYKLISISPVEDIKLPAMQYTDIEETYSHVTDDMMRRLQKNQHHFLKFIFDGFLTKYKKIPILRYLVAIIVIYRVYY